MNKRACPTCAQDMNGRSPTAIYCSVRCWNVANGRARAVSPDRRRCALPECGADFQPYRDGQRCCSERHGKVLWNRESRADGRQKASEWNDRRRDAYHRRRALKKQATTGEPVSLEYIRQRDGSRCHICRKQISIRPWPHPQSASLDHLVPLTKAGAHDPANVRLAHLECNTRKGNRGGNEQLLLIG